ncbi:MAG: type IV pilin protein [Luminiphilus sp.]|nr:type IV pilin protein [Luminiphilus sp.]
MRNQTESGFTLVELLIAVVIVGVLTAVALPAYQDFVKSSRRADARNALFNLQVNQERYRSNNLSYATLAQLSSSYGVSSTSEAGHYSISVTVNTASTYTATATPAGSQIGDDCGTFAITNSRPDTSGNYADSDCWR